ncbi:MAG: flagellar basal-body MS-ring/collar protein FliF, partial [Actinomycetota bacterium]|nr:flagellar basal-body MS-ring/collar protein FliF [Actinomycetota bacterium]
MAIVPSTDWNRIRAGARQFASGFTPGQKAVTLAALLGAVVVAVLFMTLSSKPSYAVLFSGLQGQDAQKITQQLTTDHITYQLEDGGSTILVPENEVAQARLNAAATGLPNQGTVGLSLLTKAGLTTSQITQQADYLQAIQGELEQTIDGIAGVQSSQVNVAEPANQTFALSNTAPTGASVLVTMSQGKALSQDQVQAIVHLVASSVPGLDSANVTVADANGNLLAGPGVSASASSSSATAAYDTAVQAKVAGYLTSVFGPNNADVQVDATLTFNKKKTTVRQIAPPVKGAKTSFCTTTAQTKTTYTSKGAQAVGGPAGTIANAATTTTGGKYTQTKTSKTCEIGTVTTTTTQTAGSVVRQSVAVLVNKSAIPRGTTLASIRQGVAAAANLDFARGDVLAFTVAPFSTAAAQQAASAAKAAAAAGSQSKLISMARDGAPVLAVLVLVFLLWWSARRRRR